MSPDDWGSFKPYRAAKAIRARLRGNAQHVALVVALRTPSDGVVLIKHHELARETGRDFKTIPAAMQECEKAGLVMGRRTREGYIYTWCKVAYFPTPADEVGQRAEKRRSPRSSRAKRPCARRTPR